jgi:DNA-binding response OmpR family regulator
MSKNSVKILLTDDEEYILDLLEDILNSEFESVEIKKAIHGHQALEHCKGNKFDLILTDYRMPIMGGEEFVKTVRAEKGLNAETPIIIVTAFGRDADKLVELYNCHIACKPFDTTELVGKIKEVLAQ